MVTVHIPKCDLPNWECRINNVVYSYPQDTDQSVPEEVAALIDTNRATVPESKDDDPHHWEAYTQGGWLRVCDCNGGGMGGGVVAHLSEEAVRITIDGDSYSAYPLDKTYKDLAENVSMLLDEGDGYTDVYHPVLFSNGSSRFTGYPYTVHFTGSGSIELYAESETGTLYYIPQE